MVVFERWLAPLPLDALRLLLEELERDFELAFFREEERLLCSFESDFELDCFVCRAMVKFLSLENVWDWEVIAHHKCPAPSHRLEADAQPDNQRITGVVFPMYPRRKSREKAVALSATNGMLAILLCFC